jgi:hypothetical protein
MSLPGVYRYNYMEDPGAEDSVVVTWYTAPGTGGTAGASFPIVSPHSGTSNFRTTWTVGTSAVSGGIQTDTKSLSLPGTASPYNISIWVRTNKIQRVQLFIDWKNSSFATISTSTGTATVLAANTWTKLTFTGNSPNLTTHARLRVEAVVGTSGVNWVNGDWMDGDEALFSDGLTLGTWFSGDTAPDAANFKSYDWAGTPYASVSRENYYGVFVEQVAGAGMPKVNVYAAGLGSSTVSTRIIRTFAADAWTVPGWRNRNVTGTEVGTDWFPPLGVTTTYTLYVNGQAINAMSILVTSDTGWVCDPLKPDEAMPINLLNTDPGILTLGKRSLKKMVYDPHMSAEYPTGARYAVGRGGQRSAAGNVPMQINAHSNTVSDAFRTMVADSAFILVRALPSWGAPSPLMYFGAAIEELPQNRDQGGQVTIWEWEGPLYAAVLQEPVTGGVMYSDVQTNLAARTYASVQASSGAERYLDIQADPLGLGS